MAKRKSKAGPFMIPMRVNEETIRDFGIDRDQVTRSKIGCRFVPVVFVPVSEELYYEYMQESWTEAKANERKHRCLSTDKNGKLIRCPEHNRCRDCDVFKAGERADLSDLSVEAELAKENDFRSTSDPEEEVIIGAQIEESRTMIAALGSDYVEVFALMCEGCTVRDMAEKTGIPKSTVGEMVTEIRKTIYSVWH